MSAEPTESPQQKEELAPARSSCPTCAQPLPDGSDRCAHCGAVVGDHHRCVHCRAVVDVEPAPDVRFICRLCGGVRIPLDDTAVQRSETQIDLLHKATIARSAHTIWKIVATVVAAFGASSVLVLALVISVAHPATTATVMAGLAACVPFFFAALAFRRSKMHEREIARWVEAAWMAAVADVARAHGGQVDAARFAKVTRTTEAEADQLLARMSSKSLLASSVTPEGSLRYTLLDDGTTPALASGG